MSATPPPASTPPSPAAVPPAAATPAPAPPSTWKPTPLRAVGAVLIIVIACAAIGCVLYAWDLPPFRGGVERTDNAYVRGRTTVIAPQVSGYLVEIPVHDYQTVEQGAVLARIDDRTYRARLEQAQASLDAAIAAQANNTQTKASRSASLQGQNASLANARAQLDRARADMRRADELITDGSVSARERDQTLAMLRQAEATVRQSSATVDIAKQDVRAADVNQRSLDAQVEAARAQVHAASIDLEHTVVTAPERGQLGEVGSRVGAYVTNGTQLMALVPPSRWIIANYKEAQTSGMKPGQKATFTVDAIPGTTFKAHVEQLSPAAGSEFAVLKPDNATGNFVKVPQRIGVRLAVDEDDEKLARLRPGMSVETRIDTK